MILKAYQILGEFGEDYGDIVYSDNKDRAKINSLAHVEAGQNFLFCTVSRKPELDQYVDQAEWNHNDTAKTILLKDIKTEVTQ